MAKQYLDIVGLRHVIQELQKYYSQNTDTSAGRVNYAANALSADTATKLTTPQSFEISSADGIVSSTAVSFDGRAGVNIKIGIAEATSTTHGLMSKDDKGKLDGIASGAQVNVIESVSVAVASTTEATTPVTTTANKAVTITLPQYALKTEVAAGINFKGLAYGVTRGTDTDQSHKYLSDLTTTAHAGDVYIIKDASDERKNVEYIFVPADVYGTAAHWEELGNTVALGNYYTKQEVDDHNWVAADITDWSSTEAKVKNAGKADQLATARTIAIAGDAVGSTTFNGTTDASISVTISSGVIKNSHVASDAAIAQTKIASSESRASLAADIAAKVTRIASTTAAVGKIAYISTSTGDITYGTLNAENGAVEANNNGIVSGGAVRSAIDLAIAGLDVSTTSGAYLTQIGETDGKITSIQWGTTAVSTTTSSTTDWTLKSDQSSKLITAGEVDKILVNDGYYTPITTAAIDALNLF